VGWSRRQGRLVRPTVHRGLPRDSPVGGVCWHVELLLGSGDVPRDERLLLGAVGLGLEVGGGFFCWA